VSTMGTRAPGRDMGFSGAYARAARTRFLLRRATPSPKRSVTGRASLREGKRVKHKLLAMDRSPSCRASVVKWKAVIDFDDEKSGGSDQARLHDPRARAGIMAVTRQDVLHIESWLALASTGRRRADEELSAILPTWKFCRQIGYCEECAANCRSRTEGTRCDRMWRVAADGKDARSFAQSCAMALHSSAGATSEIPPRAALIVETSRNLGAAAIASSVHAGDAIAVRHDSGVVPARREIGAGPTRSTSFSTRTKAQLRSRPGARAPRGAPEAGILAGVPSRSSKHCIARPSDHVWIENPCWIREPVRSDCRMNSREWRAHRPRRNGRLRDGSSTRTARMVRHEIRTTCAAFRADRRVGPLRVPPALRDSIGFGDGRIRPAATRFASCCVKQTYGRVSRYGPGGLRVALRPDRRSGPDRR